MTRPRTRLGFLIPPGNPTVEPELIALAPPAVSVHFSRLVTREAGGTHDGQEERNRSQIEHIGESARLLAMVKPSAIMLAHTATSYTLGRVAERELVQRLQTEYAVPVATAFGSVVAALTALEVKRIALGAPYSEAMVLKSKRLLQESGFDVVSHRCLDKVTNIFDETPERAHALGRATDTPAAQAVFLSGFGMPTISILETLEQDLGKPVISSVSATMWNALRLAGVEVGAFGYGSLLAGGCKQSVASST
jgi:maleate isomerase